MIGRVFLKQIKGIYYEPLNPLGFLFVFIWPFVRYSVWIENIFQRNLRKEIFTIREAPIGRRVPIQSSQGPDRVWILRSLWIIIGSLKQIQALSSPMIISISLTIIKVHHFVYANEGWPLATGKLSDHHSSQILILIEKSLLINLRKLLLKSLRMSQH